MLPGSIPREFLNAVPNFLETPFYYFLPYRSLAPLQYFGSDARTLNENYLQKRHRLRSNGLYLPPRNGSPCLSSRLDLGGGAFRDANLRSRSRQPSNIGVSVRYGTCVASCMLAKVGFRIYTTRCCWRFRGTSATVEGWSKLVVGWSAVGAGSWGEEVLCCRSGWSVEKWCVR